MLFSLLIACQDPTPTNTTDYSLEEETVFLTSVAMDYSVGSLASVTVDGLNITDDISTVSGDPIIRSAGGYLWQINRYLYDTIRKYDPLSPSAPEVEISVAPETGSSNPHDIALCADRLFVSLYEQDYVLVLDPVDLSEEARLSISEFSDADGRTEASSFAEANGFLYLALQGLDRNANFTPVASTILEIDCNSTEIRNSWTIGANIELIDWKEDQFLFASESWDQGVQGIYSFAPATEELLPILETEEPISALDASGDRIVFISTESMADQYTVHCFDGETLSSSPGFSEYLPSLAFSSKGELWVSAHWGWLEPSASRPGIYRFDEKCSLLDPDPLEFNLAPNSFVFVTP